MELKEILKKVKQGDISIEEAENKINANGYDDLGFAKIDHDRKDRTGESEVIFCQGKSNDFLLSIFKNLLEKNGEVLGTRASIEQAEFIKKELENVIYDEKSKILMIAKEKNKIGKIAICTGGTADIPVAEEAAKTAEFFGSKVERIYDVGVAGIHRLLSQKEKFEDANIIIAIAGMEGALATVIAGLVKVPVIAVPTSVGYGASFQGLAALLSMINSCANGVSIVNIDNGYGAGYVANQINKLIERK